MKRPIAIDLFAGAGGLSLGFEQAGFDIVAAVEIDPIHAAIHEFNFPECVVIPRSVISLTGKEIRKAAKIGNRRVDVVFGGAPCQGFSLIGQRALDDPRNALVREFVRIVSELKASYFVFENVKGLTVGKHRQFLEEIITAFEEIGYDILLPWQVLNASAYGVPQDRQRLILVGAKKGNEIPSYPTPITRAADSSKGDLPIGPSCYEALSDLPEAEKFAALINCDEVKTNAWGKRSDYASIMHCDNEDAWGYGYKRQWDSKLLTCSMRTEHTQISRLRFAKTEPGKVEPISRFFRLPRYGVSNTLRAGTDSARGAFTSPRPIHYEQARCITVREMARLHSFPDWFRFHETKWHGARQIGNAVPPALARAVATQIMQAMHMKPERPKEIVKLGDLSLLQMDMSQAARYWGIVVPIAKRDRKSGVTKRTQEEIEMSSISEAAYG
jgi:DNA (cytosine-5)-methyltransferase 1